MIYIHEGYYLKTIEEGSRRDNDFCHTESKKLEKFMLKKAMENVSSSGELSRFNRREFVSESNCFKYFLKFSNPSHIGNRFGMPQLQGCQPLIQSKGGSRSAHRIPVHYEQLSNFERGRIIGLKEAGFGKIGESLIIRFEAKRSLEDAGKKGWTMADFSVMRVAVDLEPQQIGRTD
ncbi:hypothetical protein TNCV_2641021 [Trichonephila clavipes]|nr:hypothetical protein TNCV_2641021 [Trichonephila clavipes]